MSQISDFLPHSEDETTFWETMGTSRWSQYLVEVEEDLVIRTLSRFERPGKAIEIGCDGGKWSRMLDARGWQMTCVDISPESLELCRQRLPNATMVLADADDTMYEIDSDQFDFLFAIQVPPSSESWFAKEAARLLQPGGYCVFDMMNASSYRSLLSYLRSTSRGQSHFYSKTYQGVRSDYEAEGFSYLESIGHAWAPFSRDSNSKLIPVVTKLERLLGLRRIGRFAPVGDLCPAVE